MSGILAPQEQKDLQKFLKFLSLKTVQVIVQSRLGDKVHTRSKPNAMGQDWFNLAIDDIPEITDETKKAMSGRLTSVDVPMCIEISLKTNEGDSMVLENWCLGMNQRQDAHAKITYTVYNRMGMLLKSLLSVTRVTPAYRLARKQGLDYVMCYRVYFGDVRVKELGEGFQTIHVGSVGTPVGSITLSAAYRTNLTMADRTPVMPLKSDHYSVQEHTQVTPEPTTPCGAWTMPDVATTGRINIAEEIASATATEVTEPHPRPAVHCAHPSQTCQASMRSKTIPQAFNNPNTHHAKGAFAGSPVSHGRSLPVLSSTPPFASLLCDRDSPKQTVTPDSSTRSSGSSQRKSSSYLQRKDSSSESVVIS
ncbi:autophagy-related protein 13 isoform X2 [Nematostella vectensis]|uniref:autophagy-related protein 13 isoform X2 n=1 Tax=Nematostella vectensis TaxID=45351 RepID=UPI00207750B2|nr:autophagy-related protein 13 isoform X2 [Nematostella vectensis]